MRHFSFTVTDSTVTPETIAELSEEDESDHTLLLSLLFSDAGPKVKRAIIKKLNPDQNISQFIGILMRGGEHRSVWSAAFMQVRKVKNLNRKMRAMHVLAQSAASRLVQRQARIALLCYPNVDFGVLFGQPREIALEEYRRMQGIINGA